MLFTCLLIQDIWFGDRDLVRSLGHCLSVKCIELVQLDQIYRLCSFLIDFKLDLVPILTQIGHYVHIDDIGHFYLGLRE